MAQAPVLTLAALRAAMIEPVFLGTTPSAGFEAPAVPGVTGYLGPGTRANRSMVRLKEDQTSDLKGVIDEVFSYYASLGRGFRWLVGPNDNPRNQRLAAKLEAAGMRLDYELLGLVRRDLTVTNAPDPGIEIREVETADMAQHPHLISETLGFSLDRARGAIRRYDSERRDIRARNYIAYAGGQPAGFGIMVYLPGRPLANLRLSGVLEPFRRRGIYHALVARRLADAADDGVQAVIVTALRESSYPLLLRQVFEHICTLHLYSHEAQVHQNQF